MFDFPLEKIMTKSLFILSQDDNMLRARQLFREHRIHHLPVTDEKTGRIVGIVSSTDVESVKEGFTLFKIKNREEHNRDILEMTPVSYAMKKDVCCLSPFDTIREAYLIFKKNDFRCIPVVDRAKLVGIVTPIDLLDCFFENTESETDQKAVL